MPSDPTLLVHWNGTDGQTSYTTEDDGARTVTFVANAQLDTAQQKFGTASLLGDGIGDYCTVPASTDWTFGTGNFTIDFWVRFNATAATAIIIGQGTAWANFWGLFLSVNGTQLEIWVRDGNVSRLNFSVPWTPSIDTWYHVAIVRNGTTSGDWFWFVDGTALTKTLLAGGYDASFVDLGATLNILDGYQSNEPLNGWIDELRIVKGIAKWTSNFTPPTSEYGAAAPTGIMTAKTSYWGDL